MLRQLAFLREAWSHETRRRKAGKVDWTDREFLPAALEVVETPPSRTSRLVLWLIISAALFSLLWASLAKVDTVAIAEGRLVPAGRLRTVEAAEPGVVQAIAIREGDRVTAGQVLISLDATVAEAEALAAQAQLETASLARDRARSLLGEDALGRGRVRSAQALAAEMEAVAARRRELNARIAGLRERRAAAAATVRVAEANMAKLQLTLPIVERQVAAYQTLLDKGFGSQIKLNSERERLIAMTHEITAEQARRDEAQAQYAALAREIAQAEAEFRGAAAREQAEAEGAVATRAEELRMAQERSARQTLTAPVSGVVQEVAVTTLGQVAETGKALVTIVPDGETLVVEALILNRDIGAVRVGDPAAVKIEAFPFTRYGTLPGKVTRISPDSIVDERRGLVFPATIRLEAKRDGRAREIRIGPGMAATAEIVTGRRRVIEFLWSPVARAVSEAGRER